MDHSTGFRNWITNKWFEHKREVLSWEKRVVSYEMQVWFKNNKWFLKNLYKEHNKDV